MIGDTASPFQLTDGEVLAQYDMEGEAVFSTAASLCYALAGKYAVDVSVTLSAAGIAESASARYEHYLSLAKQYASKAAAAGEEGSGGGGAAGAVIAIPYVGGVDAGEMNDVDLDINRPRPAFGSTERYPPPYSTWRP